MVFNSYEFLVFFPIVVLVYFVIPKKIRHLWLLVTSYYFYMCWNPKYVILIALSTIVTYAAGLLIHRANEKKKSAVSKKGIVAVSFIVNLGILGFFKYSNFMITNMNLFLEKMHISSMQCLDIVLPVGISFYTFQVLSYTADVYRGEIKAERNILKYALFVSFFPQLVAGPIERSGNMLSQINRVEKLKLWNLERFSEGLLLMLWGFFQKMVIADRISIFVDAVYSEYWMYGSVELVIATVFFAIQIYCDFGSYSLIATGAAKAMGFELMENFNTPYFSKSIQEFWRRWHISLSTWFRDYLYIPLGGSRCSKIRKYLNVMITFLVSGLWHGASWSFVIWGGLHGIYQIVGDLLMPVRNKIKEVFHMNTHCMSYDLGRIIITFSLTCFAWIFFRMNSLSNSIAFIKRMFTRPNPWVLHDQSLYNIGLDRTEMNILIVSLAALLLVDLIRCLKGMTIARFLKEQNTWFRWGIALILFFSTVIYGIYGPSYDPVQFIYFQF